MLSPNAEQIEEAAPQIATLPAWLLQSQLKELDSFGPGRLAKLKGITLPPSLDGMPEPFRLGYLLGVQTARYVLTNSATLALVNIKAEDLL